MDTVSVTLLRNGAGMEQLLKTLGLGGAALAILTLLSVWVLIKLGSVAAALWFDARFPELSDALLSKYQTRKIECVLVGLVNVVLGVLLALILLNIKVLALFGLALIVALYALGFVAYMVTYRHVGASASMVSTWDTRSGTMAVGAVIAEGTFFIPLLGQILSLLSLLRGFGAVTLALLARRKSASLPGDTSS